MLKNHFYEGKIEAGCDEAGRGCLAGSVFAAAVILPDNYQNDMLNDSKQLTEKKRYQLREQIERDAVAWAVGIVTAVKTAAALREITSAIRNGSNFSSECSRHHSEI